MIKAPFSTGCLLLALTLGTAASADEPGTPPDKASMELANPAAVFCVDNGGSYEIRSGTKGQFGVCKLADGREVDAWDYLREEQRSGDSSQ